MRKLSIPDDTLYVNDKSKKPLYDPKWPMGPVLNSSFLSMKRLGVLLLPPGWDAIPSQCYPQHICWYPFVHLGGKKHCESKVSCLITQHNDPGQGSNPDHLIRSQERIFSKRVGRILFFSPCFLDVVLNILLHTSYRKLSLLLVFFMLRTDIFFVTELFYLIRVIKHALAVV